MSKKDEPAGVTVPDYINILETLDLDAAAARQLEHIGQPAVAGDVVPSVPDAPKEAAKSAQNKEN